MMNILGRPDIDAGEVFVNFNQNVTSLAVATKAGYSLYSLGSIDSTLDKIYSCPSEEIFLIERLFESSLVAIVSQKAPRKLRVCHFKKQSEICNYSYSNTILAVKLNRERLIVCLEESLYIHNIQDMKVVHTIRDTPCNPNGLCALSSSEQCYLAYPGSTTSGEVQIFDAINLHAKTMIPAHDTPLAAIAFSPSGTEIATASERGTVIRVFSTLDGAKLFELRRGLKRCVSIASLSFSTCAEYLVSSSNTETVHIFRLDRSAAENAETKQSSDDWMGYSFFRFLSKTVTSVLPSQVTDVFSQGRAFASVTLPEAGIRRMCAIATIHKQLRLLVASQDGYLYVYSIPSVEGGECQLIKKHDLRLDDSYAMDVKVDSPQPLGGGGVNDDAKSSPSGPSYASAVKGDENAST
ncbi:WD repeat domain phosphoinositide-interacting protein 2 isoform X1 [Teleopsis dalmanni]|uniref:WD repeat domain phosphoinositide-interacting protein 2 isoform X1 n=1 Tax=Teleopsis dalmanni TaxID=139649 RepID=UPI0018CFE464|nr:WD repeat domain phosphoinositide-interacting protein 2 isoform X1 [Teleopsis dalmanni]XP_037934397.1 WD repeat domain phosphoinositide-interacting protein 2 isoform X1 [Teleopsis dalmanni]XP_037934398.1 WD repeat domain phosphoinositide-interacting protein 2 isoform X1 [Teleopsis dalmanni]